MNLKNAVGWIFDNDGLLQDTEPDYEWSFSRIAKRHGRPAPNRELLMRVKGIDLKEVARLMIENLALPIDGYAEFKKELDEFLFERAPHATMMPGAEDLIKRLREQGKKLAVATSSTTEIFSRKTSKHSVYELFDAYVCGDDKCVKKGKPAPDLLLVAAERLGVTEHSSCVYVGDNPVDVQAAHAAKMISVAVPGSGRAWSEFSGALFIYSNLKTLLHYLR